MLLPSDWLLMGIVTVTFALLVLVFIRGGTRG